MEYLSIGIDVGKKFSVLFAVTRSGAVVLDGERMSTLDVDGWRQRLGALKERYELHAAFEVGPHYDWLYDLLKEFCAEVVVVNAAAFGVIAKSQKKTDKLDAQKLAEGLLRGDLPDVWVPDKQTRADRRLVAFTHFVSQELTSVKTRLRSLLLTYRLECPCANILSPKAQAWLSRTATPALDAQGQMMLRMLLEQAAVLVKQRAALDDQVRVALEHYPDATLARSVPGFGPLTALAVLCAIGQIGRFLRPEELTSYFGVCGAVWQSGQSLRQGPLTKRGNVHVRWLLSQALLHLHKRDARARARYQRLKRRKHRGVARGAMMRWLTQVLWHVLSKREPYRLGSSKQKVAA